MAINIPAGSTQFEIEEESATYILKTGDTRSASGGDAAIFGAAGVDDDKIIVNGHANQLGTGFGVQLSGIDMQVQVGAKGGISGASGLEFTGSNASLVNNGQISGSDEFGFGVYFEGSNTNINNTKSIVSEGTGIFARGPNSVIHNEGTIQGQTGIEVEDARVAISVGLKGKVIGTGEAAIFSENTEATDKITITNHGHITGQSGAFAIELGDGNDKVVNSHGTISGRIYMGTGIDVFDARGGTVDHMIEGGAGDDTLITDKAGTKLKENGGSEGFDTVKSTVTYTLSQNVEQLILIGKDDIDGKGNAGGDGDYLMGNSGDNKLFGIDGDGSDTFIFKSHGGHDTLMDFDAGTDHIDVSKWNGIDNFSDVKHHATNVGDDVHITLGNDELIIRNTHKADLHAGDFFFDVV
jgi:hypothetical protein